MRSQDLLTEEVTFSRANIDNGAPGPLRTPARSLEAMNRASVGTALLSCDTPFGSEPAAARTVAAAPARPDSRSWLVRTRSRLIGGGDHSR